MVRAIAPMTTMVTNADTGAAYVLEPSGTCSSMSKIMGATETGISMITVPATAGVRTRRKNDKRAASAY